MTSPQAMPSSNASSPGEDTDLSQYAAAMGVQRGPDAAAPASSPSTSSAYSLRRQQLESVSLQVKQLSSGLESMAKQFPQVSKEIGMVQTAMTRILVKIVGSATSGSTPTTGALG